MARKIMNREILPINTLEQEYIATCYPLPDRPGLESCAIWKEKLAKVVPAKKEVDLSVPEIALAFPYITGLARRGYFESTTVQEYFEGLSDDVMHDRDLYIFARNVSNNLKGKDHPQITKVIESVLDCANGCSVKPVDLTKGKMWTFGGITDVNVDQDYFGSKIGERLVLVHGISDVGPIAIRELTQDEFDKYTKWFDKTQKRSDNPFVKI
jgi:hypothetical protein